MNEIIIFENCLPFLRDYVSLDSLEEEFTWSISRGPVQNSSGRDSPLAATVICRQNRYQ